MVRQVVAGAPPGPGSVASSIAPSARASPTAVLVVPKSMPTWTLACCMGPPFLAIGPGFTSWAAIAILREVSGRSGRTPRQRHLQDRVGQRRAAQVDDGLVARIFDQTQ